MQGRIHDFPKGGGGVEICSTKSGGRVLSGASGLIQKQGGCLAEEGEVPYTKGGVATPHPPPPVSASGMTM